ncbi:hypothetical protein A2714_03815 [Candidatus Woesebacteria bacterium RIFCSPHIGHO2_01_FULL_38_9]|uniref:Uncharacterized protein n=2 Tax=Candidatus Woeseibacteriota TaxID=1752722 RepID=A0A1F7Y0C6_9BACT|nr:MAG: hypothetical protein A2714_03815 [Candidatus Woesebacteria bacterium RIFCSPHIGHO2_01_FULL_38_9]OGM59156.1 MAG: hypothetical protein A3A75_02975 [Candidatus Woesebacteria bacterium RIFCSPLOWO2_01_FULL_39_10]
MTIPFLSTPDKALTSTTQDLIPIADIVDGVVIYKNGGAALIMESTSLNFGLLSEREQNAVIASYAGLLNSFNFPTQIIVRTQKKDISRYMEFLTEAEKKIKNPKLFSVMEDYKMFILDAIKKKNVLSKKFYVVIPFTPYELGVAKSILSTLRPSGQKSPLPYPKSYVVRKAKIALLPRRDHLIRQAGRLQIKLRPLASEDLIKLIYNVYNPESPVKEKDIFS